MYSLHLALSPDLLKKCRMLGAMLPLGMAMALGLLPPTSVAGS